MTPDTAKPGALAVIRTVIVVTLVSVLIWIVAEGESVSRERVETTVRLVDGEAGLVIRPLDPTQWTGRVVVALEGSTSEVSSLRDRLRDVLMFRPGDPGVPTEPGRHELDLAEVFRQSRLFEGTGVSLTTVEPESVGVMIDSVTWQNMDVRVEVPDAASASSPVADPRRVRVQVPSLLADRFAGMQTLTAQLSADQISRLEVGRRNVIEDVPLELPPDIASHPFVRLDPDRVNVTVTLESRQDSVTLPNVPVQVRGPAFESEKWIVAVNPEDHLLENVTVTGPSELIEEIRSGRLTIFATVVLTLGDRDARITQKEARFSDLPTPLTFEAPSTTVRLSIRPVGEAGTP